MNEPFEATAIDLYHDGDFALASAVVDASWPAPNLMVFFAQIGLVLPLAGVGAWVLGLERSERALIVAALQRALRLVPAPARDSA